MAASLVIFPIVVMFCLALMSSLGLGMSLTGQTVYVTVNGSAAPGNFYDSTDHVVCDSAGHFTGEVGNITWQVQNTAFGQWGHVPMWHNSSGNYNIYDATGAKMIQSNTGSFSLWSSFGWIALVMCVMVGGGIAGFHFLGSGENEFSTQLMVLGGAFITVWTILSVIAMPMVTSIPVLGVVGYGFLTFMYTIGFLSWTAIGHGGAG